MAAAAATPPGGRSHAMLSVVGLSDADLERLCAEAREQLGGDTVCQLANYLFPQVRTGCTALLLGCLHMGLKGIPTPHLQSQLGLARPASVA